MTAETPPEPKPRPKFAQWLFDRRLKPRTVGPKIGCSHEHVRRICLPYDDPDRRDPSADLKQAIEVFTWGGVSVEDWDRSELARAA